MKVGLLVLANIFLDFTLSAFAVLPEKINLVPLLKTSCLCTYHIPTEDEGACIQQHPSKVGVGREVRSPHLRSVWPARARVRSA
jgi:hypothetical protein